MLWKLGVAAILMTLVDVSPTRVQPPRRSQQPARATAGAEMLITPAQLREQIARGGVVVLHVGERADYNAGHIPGARFFPYDAVSRQNEGLMLELPPAATLDSLFESLGVADDSRVVLYWGKDWYSPTTRVFLTLDYLGLGDRTSILDGGFAAWRSSGAAVTKDVPQVVRGSLTVHPKADVIVDARTVRAAIGDGRTAIIDARDGRFYTGEAEGMHVREGHVPSARNVPFKALIDESGAFKSREQLESILDAAGAGPGKRVIGYCHIGQQATMVYFAGRLLGRDVHLYDGSWDEWSRKSELPIETGKGK